ncbi:MAG: short chain dehydrogenase [Desulfobacterales bacterium]|nr:short chain dehydrogenase [Desulfobacterales bacterium]
MKIIIVGASGRIGKEVDKALSVSHDIIRVGSRSGDVQCDYTIPESVREMFEKIGDFDALISVIGGDSIFKPFADLDDDDYRYGFERKFLGQIRFLKIGESFVRDNGSFVFTSGFLSQYPNPASIATGPLNAAVNTFVKNTASLLTRGIRINVVSPAPIVEPGQEGKGLVTAAETAKSYVEAVEGNMTGRIFRAWGGLPVVPE